MTNENQHKDTNVPKSWKERFEELNRKCDEAYGCGKFPPEVESFISEVEREAREECLQAVEEASNDYNAEGMGCGLEDRNITDRYQAMEYGFDKAIEMVRERMPESTLHTTKEETK